MIILMTDRDAIPTYVGKGGRKVTGTKRPASAPTTANKAGVEGKDLKKGETCLLARRGGESEKKGDSKEGESALIPSQKKERYGGGEKGGFLFLR